MRQLFSSWTGMLTPQQARMWKLLVFLTRMIALSLPLYLVMWLGMDLYPLQAAAASHSAWILHAMGYQAVQDGIGITMGNGFSFFIIPDCTGWKSMLLFFALIFAVPGVPLRKRFMGLLAGIPLVWIGNLSRLVGVVYFQAMIGTEAALTMHDTIFQAGLIAVVLSAWSAWLLWTRGRLPIPGIFSRQK